MGHLAQNSLLPQKVRALSRHKKLLFKMREKAPGPLPVSPVQNISASQGAERKSLPALGPRSSFQPPPCLSLLRPRLQGPRLHTLAAAPNANLGGGAVCSEQELEAAPHLPGTSVPKSAFLEGVVTWLNQ